MNISDEKLSAFLDAELPEAEMAQIRLLLEQDNQLSDRLVELAMTDQLVAEYAAKIDQAPLPDSISHLVSKVAVNNNVIEFPWWLRAQNGLQRHAGLAASIAVMLGVGVMSWWQPLAEHQWELVRDCSCAHHSAESTDT